jgi:general secretion pathway protein A
MIKHLALGATALSLMVVSVHAEQVGARAKGGYPESLFIETVPRAEAQATAAKLAKAVIAARTIIFAYSKKFVDPALGDKGFSGEFFEQQWRAAFEGELVDATPTQKRIFEKLFWAGRQVIENNQDRLNLKGVAWKNFLPAKWEREMGQVFTARTGIIIKQPGRAYRSPVNVPDDTERAALEHYVRAGQNESAPLTSYASWGKQNVYRHMEPIRLIAPCLSCHGKPKGELDMVGFEKDGLEVGDVIGLMSVSIAVTD